VVITLVVEVVVVLEDYRTGTRYPVTQVQHIQLLLVRVVLVRGLRNGAMEVTRHILLVTDRYCLLEVARRWWRQGGSGGSGGWRWMVHQDLQVA
jgi:hypothetical protein